MTQYKNIEIENLNIFYREAGCPSKKTLVLLHGFPTSSQMFRNLIPKLENDYHVIAPDYPGFGNSSIPSLEDFDYSFDNLSRIVEKFLNTLNIEKFSLYLLDYGAPVGFRIAKRNPGKIEALLIQNGNA
ncbi:MAG: alpha/beta fold hydrolase [Candidatus Caenarcaniphilales bacterium]|nr:alpha/beta fold hydrolase [Candidatus Caenarcaniphilales bacterium]